ncbi:CdaR family transcriptional regulator [Blastococcus saxobsidens]|uniref:CdaR family transcriptional regulator n=1 Tax=Blastococcus saxobsidens TaxID=138336 RepID=A0A6L9W7E9_9ACTN|nr:CdaR family transcriptional regulator [Blastococcus saxobsidens]
MTLEDDLRTLADGVRERLPALATKIARRLREEIPEFYLRDDPVLRAAESETITTSVRDILDGMTEERPPPEQASDTRLREARLAAQADVDLHALLRTSRVGQALTWDCILEVADELIPDSARRLPVLRHVSQYHFAWNDRVTASIIEAYQREYHAFYMQGRDRKRRALVRDLLAGIPVDEAALGYAMRGRHLGVIAWGAEPEATIKKAATALGWQSLSVSGAAGTVVGWLGRPSTRTTDDSDLSAVEVPRETHLAVGQYANDVEGMQRTYRQAWQAYRVARIHPQPLTRYSTIALEALVLRDLPAVRDFIVEQLGPLYGKDERAKVLRETLRAYFASGQNAAATASIIGVHERTVAYRLRSAEKVLERSIATARDELSIALRMYVLLQEDERTDLATLEDQVLGPAPL